MAGSRGAVKLRRSIKPPAELVSDIGVKALNLMTYSESEVKTALHFVWGANPVVFEWLLHQLQEEAQIRDVGKGKAGGE